MRDFDFGAGYWVDYPVTYRTEQVAEIMNWVNAGESGVVVGGSGTGKSNLVGFLSSRSAEAITPYATDKAETFCFLHLDINSLPTLTELFFYRGLVQALQDVSSALGPDVQQAMQQLVQSGIDWSDVFAVLVILQKAHRLVIQQAGKKVVWLLDRFDETCQRLDPQTLSSLRSLRDQFKGQLSYILFTRHPLARLREPREFDEFHEIVAANTCWVGPMVERDARWVVDQMADRLNTTFSEPVVDQLLKATGGLPAFLKLGCLALADGAVEPGESRQTWTEQLLSRGEFRRNCQEIWDDLTSAEQTVLLAISVGASKSQVDQEALTYLKQVGLLMRSGDGAPVQIFSPILMTFVAQQRGKTVGRLELDQATGQVSRDGIRLDIELTTYENRLLTYLLQHSAEICEKDALVTAIWPDEYREAGISDERLAQLIARLRRKIEPDPARPVYIQTIRGRGYRFVQPDDGE